MDWKFCWIVSMIFVILFKISQLESKLENKDLEETKEYNTYEIPEELRNMNFDERMDHWTDEQENAYKELNKLREELHELETQIRKQKQDMFNGKW